MFPLADGTSAATTESRVSAGQDIDRTAEQTAEIVVRSDANPLNTSSSINVVSARAAWSREAGSVSEIL